MKKWTKKEDQKLLTLRGEGKSYKELAKSLNRSPSSIANRLNKLNKQVEISEMVTVVVEPEPVVTVEETSPNSNLALDLVLWAAAALAGFAIGYGIAS